MPTLKNQRHELFAQALAKGKTADDAYQEAGYHANRGNATTLKAKQSIQDRIAELQNRAAIRTEVTIESIAKELAEAFDKAKAESKGASAMVSAAMGKAKLYGLVVDKREDVTPARSPKQVDARIRQLLDAEDEDRAVGSARGAGVGQEADAPLPTVPGHGTA